MYKYEIIKKIGSGTGTLINLCKKDGKEVVLKELIDSDYFNNLKEEVEILTKLFPHKHIIHINENFIFDKKIYLEYEYCNFGDLYDYIKDNGVLSEKQAIALLSQLISAISHSKKIGYYHCDIKPENVLLRTPNEFVLCDWDLAKKVQDISANFNYGSTLSMAPEIILGQMSDTSDIYSLGCLLYFCLFGKRVFDLTTSEPKYKRVLKHLEFKFELPKNDLSPSFQDLITLMLYKNPKKRATLEEIEEFLNGKNISSREDNYDIYNTLSDYINDENIKKNKKKSLKKYENNKVNFDKDGNETSKDSMCAHLIILAYLKDNTAQEVLSRFYKNGIIEKDLIKSDFWQKRNLNNRKEERIFISLAAYCDDMLEFTLKSAYNNAKYKKNIFFGVVDQNYENQREKIKILDFSQQIRYCHVFPNDTLGVSWARHLVFSLYDNEEYCLQVDSHTYFEENWDENLINQYNQLLDKSLKPIISTYPYDFSMDDSGGIIFKKPSGKSILVLRPKSECNLSEENLVLQFSAQHVISNEAINGCHIAAGFLFTKGSFIEEIPYDPYLYFHGEEQSLSLRAYTKGWDIYHPIWIPLYHQYKKANISHNRHHWHGEISKQRDLDWVYLQKRSKDRLSMLIKGELNNSIYGLGTVRSIQDFINFSGIDYRHYTINDILKK